MANELCNLVPMAGNCDPSNLAESPNLQQCLHELQTKLDRCRGNIISFNIHDKDPGLREAVTELSFECQKIGEKLDSFVELLCRIKSSTNESTKKLVQIDLPIDPDEFNKLPPGQLLLHDEPPTVHVMATREVVGQDHPRSAPTDNQSLPSGVSTDNQQPPSGTSTDNQQLSGGLSTVNQTNEQPPDNYDHTQFDKLIENFKNEDDFCNSFVDFDDTATKQVSHTSRLSEKRSKTEDKDFVPVEIELDDESEDESDFEEGEKLSEVKTVVEVAEDIGTEDLFDMRVLGCPPPSQDHIDVLKKNFGHSKFKPEQWRIIHSLLFKQRDNCAIMATGFGKSLCYQFPAVYAKQVVLVVSPLISLMEDQAMALNVKGIPAIFLGSAQSDGLSAVSQILSGSIRVVYLTPEYITRASTLVSKMNKEVGILLVAVDEAHCVSQWGHNFRSDYRNLGVLKSWLPKVPILALTATATPPVRKDICNSLKLKNPLETSTSFDRPNLYLEVHARSDSTLEDLKPLMLATKKGQRTAYSFEGPTIVYCKTKQMTENVEAILLNAGVKCAKYHAGLSPARRKEAHQRFLRDDLQCIVATVAFGMGIDKPDIRMIIHYGAPQDIETYYQEIGRAGRDGLPSKCHVYYKHSDFHTNRFFLKDLTDMKFKSHKLKMLVKMERYLGISDCRRKVLLSHFSKKVLPNLGGHRDCCDNCRKRLSQPTTSVDSPDSALISHDYSKDARMIMGLISDSNRHGFGLTTYISILRGSQSQKLSYWGKSHRLHGKGMHHSEKWWKEFGFQLKLQGYVQERPIKGSFGSTIHLSAKGRRWFNKDSPSSINFTPSDSLISLERAAQAVPSRSHLPPTGGSSVVSSVSYVRTVPAVYLPTTENPDAYQTVVIERKAIFEPPPSVPKDAKTLDLENALYQELVTYRNEVAMENNVAPFLVASNKLLAELARARPSSEGVLKEVEGVSEKWLKDYSQSMLKKIAEFCQSRGGGSPVIMDVLPTSVNPQPHEQVVKIHLVKRPNIVSTLTDTQNISYNLFTEQKISVVDVAKKRGLSPETVLGHLASAMEKGYFVDYRRAGLTDEKEALIRNAIRKEPICSDIGCLSAIKQQLPDSIKYGEIKVTIALLSILTGFVQPNKTSPLYSPNGLTSPSVTPSSQVITGTPSMGRSTSDPETFSGPSSSTSGWHGGRSYSSGRGTKRKLPSSFTSGSSAKASASYNFKHKSRKFW